MKKYLFLILFAPLSLAYTAYAQTSIVKGTILDKTDNSPLVGVTVLLTNPKDSTQKLGTITDIYGHFELDKVAKNNYILNVHYIGYSVFTKTLSVLGNTNVETIKLEATATLLQTTTIKAQQIAAQQNGDTTNFNAGAYKTNPDATAEDLIKKMPGITTDGGTIKSNGEEVKKVLVDGKPFFGDDPNATIKNLPADIIDKIQVFDKLSEQSQLTGFDDGQGVKAINIVTKKGKKNGRFGKVYGGYGFRDEKLTDNLYIAGGNINLFNGDRRISIVALTNNINQQNFNADDLIGTGSSSTGGGRRGGGSNFMVGQQNGITTTNSIGINYSDQWSKKLKISGSYFFNNTSNTSINSLTRNYFTTKDNNLLYKEYNTSSIKNTNHRVNLRLEYDIDSFNTIIFTPNISFQHNESNRTLDGKTNKKDSTEINNTNNKNNSDNNGYNLNASILYQHKFAKKGRTISLNINAQNNNRSGLGSNYAFNKYLIDTSYTTTLLDQQYDLQSNGTNISGSLNYTEPISKYGQLMINYSPSVSNNQSDKATMNNNGLGEYIKLDTNYSNKYNNDYKTQKGGISYRYHNKKINYFVGLNYQNAFLDGSQQFPSSFQLSRSFSNLLPNAMFNIRFSKTENIRLMYRTSTDAPSISQLQDVIDNTNSLLLRTGNRDLQQAYQHTLTIRYGNTNSKTSRSFFVYAYGNIVQDYISTQNITDPNYAAANGFHLLPGSQISRPINMGGYYSSRTFITYGIPIKLIKSNLNLNAGFNYNNTPALVNNLKNIAKNYAYNGSLVISSNISENIDFTLSYSGNYTVVKNSLQKQSDNNYYNQTTSLNLNYIFLKGFVFNTSLNHNLYNGLSQGFNQEYLLWNASIGYKFLKDKSFDVRVYAYDILNQNRSITRTVTETYIEDNSTNILQRFFMLRLTYTLRKFGNIDLKQEEKDNNERPQRIYRGRPGGWSGEHG